MYIFRRNWLELVCSIPPITNLIIFEQFDNFDPLALKLNTISFDTFIRLAAKKEFDSLKSKEEKIADLRRRRQSVKQSQIQKVDSGDFTFLLNYSFLSLLSV